MLSGKALEFENRRFLGVKTTLKEGHFGMLSCDGQYHLCHAFQQTASCEARSSRYDALAFKCCPKLDLAREA